MLSSCKKTLVIFRQVTGIVRHQGMTKSASGVHLRHLSVSSTCHRFNQPLSGNEFPRSGGIATMYRLPYQQTAQGLDVCFVGIPLDIGTSNRSGTRLGPRQIRAESCLVRRCNSIGASPYETLQVADVGDVGLNLYDLKKAVVMIKEAFSTILATGCKALAMGGDHTVSYPILQAVKEKYGTVGLVHIDAHSDMTDVVMGERISHATPFRRAIEEELIDPKKTIQIGLRGSQYSQDDTIWQRGQGVRTVRVEECYHKSMMPLMSEVRQMMGDIPVYISFDIDGIDPGYAPGTGTPEIGGLTPIQGIEILRGCRGLNIIGGDMVEVAPAYDPYGSTAYMAACLLFEMLCVLPGVRYPDQPQ